MSKSYIKYEWISWLELGSIPKTVHFVCATVPKSGGIKSWNTLVPSILNKEYAICIISSGLSLWILFPDYLTTLFSFLLLWPSLKFYYILYKLLHIQFLWVFFLTHHSRLRTYLSTFKTIFPKSQGWDFNSCSLSQHLTWPLFIFIL